MFRLNVHLPDAIGIRLNEAVESSGLTKVAITTAALDAYMTQMEVQRKLTEEMKNPEVFAKMCAAAGIDFSQFTNK